MGGPALPVVVEGVGLHSGKPSRVSVRAAPGPVCIAVGGVEACLDELEVVSTARATTVQPRGGPWRLGTVEHAFAALAGLGLFEGVRLDVDGAELPLLDGGARAWCETFVALGVPPSRPRLRVVRQAAFEVGPSRFELTPADTETQVSVSIDFGDPRLVADARWNGEASDFRDRIAPARTFALARDVAELVQRGLARHVDPASVVVVTPDAVLHAGRPFEPDEPARHKLLDLVGDLFVAGGPPIGRVHAHRPGHAVNARAIARALREGALARCSTADR